MALFYRRGEMLHLAWKRTEVTPVMGEPVSRKSSYWAPILLLSFVAAAAATALYDLPLFGNPAADLRHAVPAPVAFFTFLFLAWTVFFAVLMLGAGLLVRKGWSVARAALLGLLVLALALFLYPRGRYLMMKGAFLNAESPPQLLFIRETLKERPTLVVHGAGQATENVLSVRIRKAGLHRAPQLFRDPFYPEPDFDAFTAVEIPDDEMRRLAEQAARTMLRRPRPVHILDPEQEWRELHTCVLVQGDRVYGISVRPGGLADLLEAVEEALPPTSRDRLKPWMSGD